MTDSQNLFAEYRRNGSDAAFRELVGRFVGLVYSTALRLVEGDTHRAEDVAQTVFVDLARKARTLPEDVRLGGWLHRDTCLVAGHIMRGERRRQIRERQAIEMNALQNDSEGHFSRVAPMLDEAINELGEANRTAILLRFFEEQDFRSVGRALGSTEDGARMRVTRALDKLQGLLKRRGVTTSSAALAVALSANAVQAAPVGLAVTISTASALAGTALQTSTAIAGIKTIAMTTLQKTIVGATLAAAIAVPVIWQQHAIRELENQNRILELKLAATRSQPRNERVSAPPLASLPDASASPALPVTKPPSSQKSSDNIAEAIRLAADMEKRNVVSAVKLLQILSQLSGDELVELFQQGRQLQDAKTSENLCRAVIGFWAEKDPASALEMVTKTIEPAKREEYLFMVINRWALKDASGALAWYREAVQQEDGPLSTDRARRNALQFMAHGFAQTSPPQAFALLDGTSDPAERASILQGIAFLARDESQRDAVWQKIDQLTAPSDRRAGISSFIREWGTQDSAGASAFVEKMPLGNERMSAARSLLLRLFENNREAASAWMLRLSSEAEKNQTIGLISEMWSSYDLKSAGEWLNRQGSGPEMNSAIRGFASQAAQRDPATAMTWAQSITDATMRDQAELQVFARWQERDPSAAANFLSTSGWSEEKKQTALSQR